MPRRLIICMLFATTHLPLLFLLERTSSDTCGFSIPRSIRISFRSRLGFLKKSCVFLQEQNVAEWEPITIKNRLLQNWPLETKIDPIGKLTEFSTVDIILPWSLYEDRDAAVIASILDTISSSYSRYRLLHVTKTVQRRFREREDSLIGHIRSAYSQTLPEPLPIDGIKAIVNDMSLEKKLTAVELHRLVSQKYSLEPDVEIDIKDSEEAFSYIDEIIRSRLQPPKRFYGIAEGGSLIMMIGLPPDIEKGKPVLLKEKELERALEGMPGDERERLLRAVRYETCDVQRIPVVWWDYQ